MSDRRRPPELPGYTFQRALGAGGFSDVYRYEKHMPRREVAVKVLRDVAIGQEAGDRFYAEANVMASLASHPSIVTIYDAALAPDGRPYLVMEYYPEENLRERSLRERMRVATVLSYGVQIACAVETAHRAGILHRDIKPANILVSRVGIPALTDFGIAATLAEIGEDDEDAGLSVPWSPPEVLRSARASDARSDVWSLGATLYTLLSGRSPFEQPGGPNDMTNLMRRIEGEAPLPLDRPDVPPSLERLLLQSMAKRPAARPPSALAFAQALQAIETELGLPVTSLVVMQHANTSSAPPSASSSSSGTAARTSAPPDADDEDETRMRAPGQVLAQQPLARPAPRPRVADPAPPPVEDRTVRRETPLEDRTIGRDPGVEDRTIGRDDDSTQARDTGLPRVVGPGVVGPGVVGAGVVGAGPEGPTRRRDGGLPGIRNVDPDQMAPGVRWERSPRPGGIPTMDSTVVRDHDPELLPERTGSLRRRIVWVSVAAAALVAIGTAAALSLLPGGGPEGPTGTVSGSDPVVVSPGNALVGKLPKVRNLTVHADAAGTVVVTWANPEPQAGDLYVWVRVDPDAPAKGTDYVKTTTLRAGKLQPGTRPCFEISLRRGGQQSDAATACLS
jgi:serine/threonine protein kinase